MNDIRSLNRYGRLGWQWACLWLPAVCSDTPRPGAILKCGAMATKPKRWPVDGEKWPPNQSNAARDRDDAAMSAVVIGSIARRGLESVNEGRATRTELLYILARVDQLSSDILRLMERNGAPTRPYTNGGSYQ